jgi:hypothetical protein
MIKRLKENYLRIKEFRYQALKQLILMKAPDNIIQFQFELYLESFFKFICSIFFYYFMGRTLWKIKLK